VPSYESTVTQNLKNAGIIMMGKTNMDEFAMGSTGEFSSFGQSYNPWRFEKRLTPGGSSSGSSAAVSGGLVLGALGTDTGGSIRQPAAFTGIVGLKPTYGRCSRWGVVAFASSLDQAGPMARTVEDVACLYEAMAGHDPKDATSAPRSVEPVVPHLGESIKGLRVGIPKEYTSDDMNPCVQDMWEEGKKRLKDAGCQIVSVSLPHTSYALGCYYILAPAEASSNLARYDGVRYTKRVENPKSLEALYAQTRDMFLGTEVKRRILMGTYVLAKESYESYYRQAQKVRQLIAKDFKDVWRKVDVLLTPTSPLAPFPVEQSHNFSDNYRNDLFTATVNLAGLPAVSVPGAVDHQGLPLGLQVIGQPWQEKTILQTAKNLEIPLPLPFTKESAS